MALFIFFLGAWITGNFNLIYDSFWVILIGGLLVWIGKRIIQGH